MVDLLEVLDEKELNVVWKEIEGFCYEQGIPMEFLGCMERGQNE